MKKIIAIALAALMALGMFAGCGNTAPEATNPPATDPVVAETTADVATEEATEAAATIKTVTPGKLTIATSPDFAPMEFVDPTKSGQDMFVGFDMTLAHYLADGLGLELVIMPMSFDACMTAAYAGTVDIAISGFSWKEDREANYNLSDYYHAGDNEDEQILITLASNGEKFATAEGLKGAKIGAQNASLQQALVEEQLTESELVPIGDLGTAVLQLKNGDFDCLAVADGNGEAIISSNPEVAKSGYKFYVDPKYTGNVLMLQKGNDALTEACNKLLAESQSMWDTWYAEAEAMSGIDQSYDDEGNAITG